MRRNYSSVYHLQNGDIDLDVVFVAPGDDSDDENLEYEDESGLKFVNSHWSRDIIVHSYPPCCLLISTLPFVDTALSAPLLPRQMARGSQANVARRRVEHLAIRSWLTRCDARQLSVCRWSWGANCLNLSEPRRHGYRKKGDGEHRREPTWTHN